MAGLTGSKSFDMSVGFLAVGFVGTCLSWIMLSKYGRRRIYNIGLAILTLIMFLIAFLDFAPDYENRPGIIWAQSTLLVSEPRRTVELIFRMFADENRFSGMEFSISQLVQFVM